LGGSIFGLFLCRAAGGAGWGWMAHSWLPASEWPHLGVVFSQGCVAPGAAQRRLEKLESRSQGHAAQAVPCLQERGNHAVKRGLAKAWGGRERRAGRSAHLRVAAKERSGRTLRQPSAIA
jgi:hypothetical protein